MDWSDVGDWISDNAGAGASLVGALLTGGSSAAIAMGVSMIAGATGTNEPDKALEALKNNPDALIKLESLKNERSAEINRHIESMEKTKLEDKQLEHSTTSQVIIEGQKNADGWFEKNSRPAMAWVSLIATIAYAFMALNDGKTADMFVLGLLSSPAWAWMGLRTLDKKTAAAGLPPQNLMQKIKGAIK
jgi:hypothetical protein